MTKSPGRCTLLVLIAAFLVLISAPAPTPAIEAETPEKFRNFLEMEFVYIPPGTFQKGSPEHESNRNESEILHQAMVEKPFYMQTTPVTVDQWHAVMGRKWIFSRHGNGRLPVTRVSWHDAQKFIKALNGRNEGTYRLPTETEWEYAARAGTTTAFPWGDEIDCTRALYANSQMRVDDCIPYVKSMGLPANKPAPVKTYAPNPWGLYEMHGNIWEWTATCFRSYADAEKRAKFDCTQRVRRGGSWFGHGHQVRSANRAHAHPASRMRTTGFRLVMEVP